MNVLRCAMVILAVTVSLTSPAAGAPKIGHPYFFWTFAEWSEHGPSHDLIYAMVDHGDQDGGTLIKTREFGPAFPGRTAIGAAHAYDEGNIFWVTADSPTHGGPFRDVIGGESKISVWQTYTKDTADAWLTFTFSSAWMELIDYGSGRGDGYYPIAKISFRVDVHHTNPDPPVWTETQQALLGVDTGVLGDQRDNVWHLLTESETGHLPLWTWRCTQCGDPAYGEITVALSPAYTGAVNLADIDVGEEFAVRFELLALGFDDAQGETNARAYARDPLSSDSGVSFDLAGLTPTNNAGPELTTTTTSSTTSSSTTTSTSTSSTSSTTPVDDEPGSTTTTTTIASDAPTTSTTLPCSQSGLDGLACLLATLPPGECESGLPGALARQIRQARALVDKALHATSAGTVDRALKGIGARLRDADRAVRKAEKGRGRKKIAPPCAAALLGLLDEARDLLTAVQAGS